jgi:hypothetical protein
VPQSLQLYNSLGRFRDALPLTAPDQHSQYEENRTQQDNAANWRWLGKFLA